jgi:hypothetical protein
MKIVSFSYKGSPSELLGRFEVREDGSVKELFLSEDYRGRFDHAFSHGLNYPRGTIMYPYRVEAGAPHADTLKGLLQVISTSYKSVSFDWPEEHVPVHTVERLRAMSDEEIKHDHF